MAFQSITPVKLGQVAIPTTPSVTTVYTVPASTRTFVKDIDICNTGTTTLQATLYLVPSGGTPGTSNTLIPNVNIPPNGMFQWSGSQILNSGDSVRVTGSASGLTAMISGGEAI